MNFDPKAVAYAIANRRSMGLSRLSPEPVDRALIERMLEAANWGQSHGDTEPWRFWVFSGEGRNKLADIWGEAYKESAGDKFMDEALEGNRKRAFAAPVWIAIGMEPALDENGGPEMTLEEELMAVATAVQNLHLMACAQGLTGMWHSKGISIEPGVATRLGLDGHARLLGFFMLGWPNCDWMEGERKPVTQKVHWAE